MKVSVLCMAYNHEKYIRSALDGFVSQKTDFDYEVIVHDDASTDGTAGIIREYAEKYPNLIKPIYQTENQYSKKDIVREIMVPESTGRYIATCEGDDYWIDENKLQLQADFLDRNPEYSACAHNSYKLEMMTNQKTVMYDRADYDIQTPDVLCGGSCCYQTASLMYRREYIEEIPQFLQNGRLDYMFAIHLSLKGPIRFFNRIMSVYRVGTESSWTKNNRRNMHRNALFHKFVSIKLREIDEYTNHAYGEQIEDLILYNDYKELYFDEKYSEMRQPKYRKLYQQESMSDKIKMRLKHHFSGLYHLYRRIKY